MGEFAECRSCGSGSLLPFYSPDGLVVYFCNSCRARFSGYASEPCFEGAPIFLEQAEYTRQTIENDNAPLPEGELMEKYMTLLETYPPIQAAEGSDGCPYCGEEIPDPSSVCPGCWLPPA